jgi:2'-5' RNA ligase
MGLLRCFLAVEGPARLQEAIQTATADTRRRLGQRLVRWVPGHNVHLTLKFLGDTSDASASLVQSMLTVEVRQFEPFDISVQGIGAYPSTRRPRVIWVGVTAPPALASLHHQLDAATARLGFSAENREFSPHLTIGRVRPNATAEDAQELEGALEDARIGPLGSVRVEAIHLFKSDLRAAGSVYTRLFSAPLGKAQRDS